MNETMQRNQQRQQEIQTERQQYVTPVSPQLARKLELRRAEQIVRRDEAIREAQQLGKLERRKFIAPPVDDAPSEQAKEAFLRPQEVMRDHLMDRLEHIGNQAESDVYAKTLSETVGEPIAINLLIEPTVQTPEAYRPLCELLMQLQSCDLETLTQSQMKAMVATYQGLHLENVAPSHRYIDHMAYFEAHSAYLLLYHCVVGALEDMVEQMPPEQLDQEVYSKLYAVNAVAAMAVGVMSTSQKFKERRTIEERDYQAKREYLRTGVSAEAEAPPQWMLGQYVPLVEKALGPDGMHLPWRDFAREVERIRSRLEDRNLPAIERALEAGQKQRPGVVLVRKELEEELKTALDLRLLTEEVEELDMKPLLDELMERHSDALALYDRQREKLLQNPHLKELEGAIDQWLAKYATTDEALFQSRSEELGLQAEENLKQVRGLIGESLSSAAGGLLMEKLLQQQSRRLLMGSPGELIAMVGQAVRSLRAVAPKAASTEAAFRSAMRSAGVQNRWFRLADRRITGAKASTPQEMKAALEGLQARIDDNLKQLEQHQAGLLLAAEDWKAFDHWAMEHLDSPQAEFHTAMAEKALSLMTGQGKLVSHEQALYGPGGEAVLAKQERGVMEQQLRGEALCAWPGFGGLYQDYEEEIIRALNRVLQSEGGNVTSVHDLDTLERSESAGRILEWRSRLAGVAQPWAAIDGPQAELLRTRLLPAILRGEVHADNMTEAAEEMQRQFLRENTAQKLRFHSLFASGHTAEQNEIQYRYLDARRGGYFWTKDTRPGRRLQRLKEVNKGLLETLRNEGQEQGTRIWLGKKLNSGAMDKGSLRETPDFLKPEIAKDVQSHAFELLISGYEDIVLSSPKESDALLRKDRADYQAALVPAAKRIFQREGALQELLNKEEYKGWSRRREELRERMRPFIAGLQEGKEHAEENRSRFGVGSWEEAMEELEALLQRPELLEQNGQIAAGIDARIASLREAGEGALRPILDRLMAQAEVWQVISTGSRKEMAELEQKLLAQYKFPMNYLISIYGEDSFLMNQVVEETWKSLSTKAPDQWNWKEAFRSVYVQISEHKAGSTSLAETVHGILTAKKGTVKAQIAPYIADLIQEKGIAFLLDTEHLEENLQEYVQRIQANEQAMEEFLAANPQALRVETGFRQYIHGDRFSMKKDAFASSLQEKLTRFQALDKDDMGKVKDAKEEMRRRAEVMTDVERKKAGGRQADQDISQLRQLTGVVSPLLGQRPAPSQKEIDKVGKLVAKQYPNVSAFVRGCLTERVLAGEAVETLSTLAAQLEDSYTHLKQQEMEEPEAFLTWQQTHQQELAGQEEALQLSRFRESQALLRSVAGLSIAAPVLEAERQQVEDALTAALYTMSTADFLALGQRRLGYLKAAERMELVWEELLGPYEEKERLYKGLRDYFHAELLQGVEQLHIDDIRTKAKELLADKTSRQYLVDSTSLLGEVGYESLRESEAAPCTMANRENFEQFLAEKGSEAQIAAYNRLDMALRQIFALALTTPGKLGAVLPGSRLLEGQQRSRKMAMQRQIQAYINEETFAPQVNYSLALVRLRTAAGGIDEAVFQQVLDFALLCAAQRQEKRSVDFSRLSDSLESRTEARRILRASGKTVPEPVVPEQLTTVSEWTEVLKKQGGEAHKGLVEKMSHLKPHCQQLLIWALQDRTALDFTTKVSLWDVGGGEVRGLVNPELQSELFTTYADSGSCPQITSQSLSQALDTLYSYQLRDDVDLNHRLRKEDFVGLDRKTAVDWALLERAMELVQEMDQERTRLVAVQNATDHVMERGCEAAKAEFQVQSTVTAFTPEYVSAFLRIQAEKDGQTDLYAGFLALDESQRALFIKALGRRDILDISKKGINANRFGMGERDYVNPRGRFELIESHLYHAQGAQGLILEEEDCRNAIFTALSAQVDDSQAFIGDKQTAISNRKTAVDWKLVSRALQLVYRTTNEKDIAQEDRELYVSSGDLSETGTFQFNGEYLRQNIHNAGNRFTRFLGRRAAARLQEAIPAPVKRLALMLLPTKMANQVNTTFETEEKGLGQQAEDFVGAIGDFLEQGYVDPLHGKETAERANELVGTAGDHLGYVNAAISAGKKVYNISRLAVAEHQAKEARTQEAQTQSAVPQTAQQQALSQRARERNEQLQEQGVSKALSRQTDELVQTISSVVGGLVGEAAGDEFDIIEKLVEEAGELINFLRNWFQDKKSIAQYFTRRKEADAIRAGVSKAGLTLPKGMEDLNLIRRARGFENETEMASFVGLNIVRSLLFCAGPYNTQNSTRVLAVATLTVLGQAEAIGQQDNETAQSVYGALMGGQYR